MAMILTQLKELMTQAPCAMGLFPLEVDAEPIYLNDNYYELTGYTKDDYESLSGKIVEAMVYAEDGWKIEKIKEQFVESKEDITCEYRMQRKSGRIIAIRLHLTAMLIDHTAYALASFVRVEKENANASKNMTKSARSSISLMRIHQNSASFVFASNEFFAMSGYTKELYGDGSDACAKQRVAQDYFERILPLYQEAIRIHEIKSVDYQLTNAKGEPLWLRRRFMVIAQDQDTALLLSIMFDVTAQHAAEEILVSERNMYQGILDESSAMITIIDAKTYRILYANRAAKEVTKDLGSEYVGSICYQNIAHLDHPCENCLMAKGCEMSTFQESEISYSV